MYAFLPSSGYYITKEDVFLTGYIFDVEGSVLSSNITK
jgi:hypothetical protein